MAKNPAAVELGAKGGAARTEAKQAASRANGKKGGRKKGSTNRKKGQAK